MEWVDVTGRTLEEAKRTALDQLGVAEDDAEFEVLEEPKAGLFGRVRGQARVRARVQPTSARPRVERDRNRRDRKPREQPDETRAADTPARAPRAAKAPAKSADRPANDRADRPRNDRPKPDRAPKERSPQGDLPMSAADEKARAEAFLTGLAQAWGATSTVEAIDTAEGDVEVRLHGDGLGQLIGPRGQTLQAVQELTRLVAQPGGTERHVRLHVDIGGYREKRREALVRFTTQLAEQVLASGTRKLLEPMAAPDRKVVHDTVAGIDGVVSRSEGEDERRHVIIELG
jgi:spoIIIJ-associated protein